MNTTHTITNTSTETTESYTVTDAAGNVLGYIARRRGNADYSLTTGNGLDLIYGGDDLDVAIGYLVGAVTVATRGYSDDTATSEHQGR